MEEDPLIAVEEASLRVGALFGVDEALCAKEAREPLWGCGASVCGRVSLFLESVRGHLCEDH